MTDEYYKWIELSESVLSLHGNSYGTALLLEVVEEGFSYDTPVLNFLDFRANTFNGIEIRDKQLNKNNLKNN